MTQQLPQPTLPGKAPGIISTDPWQQQCGICGLVDEKPADRGVALWIILAGFRFCPEAPSIRHCPDCLAGHAKTCAKREH